MKKEAPGGAEERPSMTMRAFLLLTAIAAASAVTCNIAKKSDATIGEPFFLTLIRIPRSVRLSDVFLTMVWIHLALGHLLSFSNPASVTCLMCLAIVCHSWLQEAAERKPSSTAAVSRKVMRTQILPLPLQVQPSWLQPMLLVPRSSLVFAEATAW